MPKRFSITGLEHGAPNSGLGGQIRPSLIHLCHEQNFVSPQGCHEWPQRQFPGVVVTSGICHPSKPSAWLSVYGQLAAKISGIGVHSGTQSAICAGDNFPCCSGFQFGDHCSRVMTLLKCRKYLQNIQQLADKFFGECFSKKLGSGKEAYN